MEDLTPHLQFSEQDGPRRRRRPALSCVECRSRKVRCDRGKPCGPCTRTKSPTCTYRPNRDTDSSRVTPADTSDKSSDQSPHHVPQANVEHAVGSSCPSYLEFKSLQDRVRELEGRIESMREVPAPQTASTGRFVKTKFFGESHWMNAIEPYEALGKTNVTVDPNTNRTEINKTSDLYNAVLECKQIARTIKSTARTSVPAISPAVQSTIPAKDVCDILIQCYLRTFEGVFRVLHIPTYLAEYEQYWESPSTAKPSILIKILLVCAIGVPFYTGEDKARLRTSCTIWIQTTESWFSALHEKAQLNLTGIQIHILLLLAKQTCGIDGDLIWIPAGSLLRRAMHIGLHRDPSRFSAISPFHTEMRRRLWATILELSVQCSLDMGMSPMLSCQDFDTLPPSNINDDDISDGASTPPTPRPHSEITQTSLQIAFLESLPIRLEITRKLNNIGTALSFDETIRLSAELTSILTRQLRVFQHRNPATPSIALTAFQLKLLDVLTRRFLLQLHRPYFCLAKKNPIFCSSRHIALSTSLSLLSPGPPSTCAIQQRDGEDDDDDDWTRLLSSSLGFAKSLFMYSVTTLYLELVNLIEENSSSSPDNDMLTTTPVYVMYYNFLREGKRITHARLRNGEANAKGYVLLCCMLARIDALVSGEQDPEGVVLEAARGAVGESAVVMREVWGEECGVRNVCGGGDWGVDIGGDGWMSAGFEDVEMEMNGMDWEALMQEEGLGFGFGFGFGSEVGEGDGIGR